MRVFLLSVATGLLGLALSGSAQAAEHYGSHGHGRGHYDYHPGHFDRHRGHYDYHPGHYDYHRGRDYSPGSGGYYPDRGYYPGSGYYPGRRY